MVKWQNENCLNTFQLVCQREQALKLMKLNGTWIGIVGDVVFGRSDRVYIFLKKIVLYVDPASDRVSSLFFFSKNSVRPQTGFQFFSFLQNSIGPYFSLFFFRKQHQTLSQTGVSFFPFLENSICPLVRQGFHSFLFRKIASDPYQTGLHVFSFRKQYQTLLKVSI